VPLTILSAPADTEMMIIEMGANHIGEIRTLCFIARPEYGIITNIGSAHLEGFGSLEGVIKAKTELYEYLKKVNGVALYNDKNPLLSEKIYRNVNRAVPFSDPTGTELIVEKLPSDLNLNVSVTYFHETCIIKTNLFGDYNIENIKAAVATALFFDVRLKDIAEAIESYIPANNRSQVKVTNNNTLICDSYNANPGSMHLALESFSMMNNEKKLVILGDMLELGEKSEEEHKKVIEELKLLKFENVLLAGPIFSKVAQKSGYKSFVSALKLIDHLKNEQLKGYDVLIKGSRGMGLEKTYELL
jgi:UDP-N-acetylmuramoyl-tripeptide--D-alanyl-D-alanine ligase